VNAEIRERRSLDAVQVAAHRRAIAPRRQYLVFRHARFEPRRNENFDDLPTRVSVQRYERARELHRQRRGPMRKTPLDERIAQRTHCRKPVERAVRKEAPVLRRDDRLPKRGCDPPERYCDGMPVVASQDRAERRAMAVEKRQSPRIARQIARRNRPPHRTVYRPSDEPERDDEYADTSQHAARRRVAARARADA